MSQEYGGSAASFRLMFDQMLEGVQIHDSNWRYTYVNDALVKYSHYSREALLGHTVMELYPGIEQTEVFLAMQRCMGQRTAEILETEFVFPDGSTSHFELNIQPFDDGLFIFSVDRTEQVKSSEKLLKANRLYAFNSAINQSIVHITDQQELLSTSCKIAIEIGGFKLAVLTLIDRDDNLQIMSVQGQDNIAAAAVKLSGYHISHPMIQNTPTGNALRTGKYSVSNDVLNDPGMAQWKSGLSEHSIRSSISLPLINFGKIIGVMGFHSVIENFFDEREIFLLQEVAVDISFALENFKRIEKHNQTALLVEANEKRFRALIEKSADLKTLATREGKLIYCSPTLTKILGWKPEELKNKAVFEIIHPDDLPDFLIKRNAILEKPGAFFWFEQRRRHKNRKWVWCEGTLTNMLHEPGVEAMVTNLIDITEKKQTEAQTEFNANNQFALINNTADLMWSVDKNYRLITANLPFDEFLTQSRGKPIPKGSKILDGTSPAEEQLYKGFYKRALQGETFTEIVNFGRISWSEISFHPIRKANNIIGTACHSRDISEFVNLSKALKDTVKEISDFKYALDESSIVAITDHKGAITHVNDNFCRVSKYSREELIGQDHRIVNSGYHSKDFIHALWKTIAKGNIWRGELKNKAKDGSVYWVDTTIIPFLNAKNKPYQYIAIRSDITQKKAIEFQLHKSEEFSRTVLDSLSAHIAVIDSAGNIVAVNNEWELFAANHGGIHLYGHSKDFNYFEVCKKSYHMGDALALEVMVGIKGVINKEIKQYYLEYPCFSKNSERWFAMLAREFYGDEPMVVIAHQDITQRKLAEAELIKKNAELQKTNFELDRFVYSVSHDLRSPLTAVLGLINFIEEETLEADTLTHVRMIRSRIVRLDEFIKNILNYSRNNRMAAQIEPINLYDTIESAIGMLCISGNCEGIDFEIEVEKSTLFYSDKQGITTILENLISNAIKFFSNNQQDVRITIAGHTTSQTTTLIISDNGIGIAPEYQGRVFDMFYRISGDVPGSGLGLYIVKSIVEKLGGTIALQSEKGSGTTFTITLNNNDHE